MKNVFFYLAWASILAMLCLMGLFFFWWTYPYDLVTYHNDPIPVLNENKTIKKGGTLTYELNVCQHTDIPAIVTKSFIDGITFELSQSTTIKGKGCLHKIVDVDLPKSLPAGTYRLRAVSVFKPNPIRVIRYVLDSEEFKVIE